MLPNHTVEVVLSTSHMLLALQYWRKPWALAGTAIYLIMCIRVLQYFTLPLSGSIFSAGSIRSNTVFGY